MSLFDQRGQHVNTQYNAQHMNFGAVQNTVDLVTELQKLKEEIAIAQKEGLIDKKQATDVEYQVTKASQEVEEPEPNEKTIIDHLTTAKSFIEGIAAASGLVTGIVGAVQAVQKLFS